MKTPTLLGLALLAIIPVSVSADSATDRKIEDTARATYNFRRVLDDNVDIAVKDGVATLTGKVKTEEQRWLAEDTAANIPGVTRVQNQVEVDPALREGTDDWIAMKIRSRLLMKANVSMTDTDVRVNDGVVTLMGSADSQAQKELTEAYARDIKGVREVVNKIAVVPSSATSIERKPSTVSDPAYPNDRVPGRESLGEKIDDGSITAQIKYELFANRGASGLKTKVRTDNGHVLITGEAETPAEKDLVTKLAKTVRGVVSVHNNMTVRNP